MSSRIVPSGIFETHHTNLVAIWPFDLLQRRNKIDLHRLELLVGLVDIINRESNTADTDIVKRRIRLSLGGWIDELH